MDAYPVFQALQESIGNRVTNVREHHGMTISELAKKMFIRVSRMKAIESGKRELGIINALMLKDIFGVSLDYLFAGHTEGLTPENSGLPPLNLDASEWEVFSEFMAAYALISPIERYDDLIYELMRHTLSHYTKLIHANLIEK